MSAKQIFGNRRGEVIDNVDPLGAGRVKIRVFGVYDDLPDDAIPWALYSDPFMGGNSDVGGRFIPDMGNHMWVFFEEGDPEQPVYFAGAPARSDGPMEAVTSGEYPHNKVFKTKSGHTIEFDDTEGNTRIRIAHKSDSQKIWAENGDVEEQIIGTLTIIVEQDANIHVKGNANETIDGDCLRVIKGNLREVVDGNFNSQVKGDHVSSINGRRKEVSSGGSEYLSTTQVDVAGSHVALNRKKGAAVETVDGEFVYTLKYAYTYSAARELVDAAGSNAPFDTPEDLDLKLDNMTSGEFPEETDNEDPKEENTVEDKVVAPIEAGCPTPASDIYATPIGGAGRTVRSLTLDPVFKHKLQAQNGFSVEDLICNAHHLCLNVVDPILEAFPNLRINSGFRRGASSSQHNKMMAIDFQFPNGNKAMYKDVLDFIAANIPYDQCIYETSNGSTFWIHVSFDRTKGSQRKSRLTYRGGKYTSGWTV